MANKALKVLVESLNAQIKALNSSGLKVYDDNDPSWYIDEVVYDSESDKLVFKCKDDFWALEVANQ